MLADCLLTVINDILDFSKIEAGKMELDLVNFNLRDCLEEALKPLALRADEKGLAGEAYMAWHMLQEYLHFISVNTFHLNGDPRHFGDSRSDSTPMTLEAGFASAAALMEMLLQSWGGRIRVFPAVPEFCRMFTLKSCARKGPSWSPRGVRRAKPSLSKS